jgi:cholesterol transport system auxiliary component
MKGIFTHKAARTAAALGVLLLGGLWGLGGCVSLLPKEKPVQLYRFGADSTAPTAQPATGPGFTLRTGPISFEAAANGDRILTVVGDQTAYVSSARWIAPAGTLFRAAVTRAFDTHGGAGRLLAQGEPAPADYALKLDVRAFEVRYAHSAQDTPKVVVEVYAALDNRKEATDTHSRLFEAEVPASSNSIHAITAAFDDAVAKVLGEIVAWSDTKGAG